MCDSGSSGPTETTVNNVNLPEWAEPWFMDIMNRAAYQSSLPYESYPEQRLAYFSPMDWHGFDKNNHKYSVVQTLQLLGCGSCSYCLAAHNKLVVETFQACTGMAP